MTKQEFIEKLDKQVDELTEERWESKDKERKAQIFGEELALLYVIDQLRYKVD